MNKFLVSLCILYSLALPVSAQNITALKGLEENRSRYVDPPAADGYCEYISGAAASQAAPFLSPVLFGSVGNASAEILPSPLSPVTSVANRTRFFGGSSFSLGNVQRGLAMKQKARADCEQYRVTAGLEAFLQDNWEALTSDALEAREQVLQDGLVHTKEILSRSAKLLEAHVSTDQEYHAMQLRRDELQQILEQTDSDLGKAAKSESLVELSLPDLLKKQQELQMREEVKEAEVRESGTWDVTVRGGYQRIFNAPQATPYFGTVTLSFNLGRLRQANAERQASIGFRQWIQEDPAGPSMRTYMVLEHFRAIQTAETARLRETEILIQDLEQRLESLRRISDERAQSYQDYVWFDYIKLKAEHSYLVAHLRDLAAVVGSEQP